MWHEMIDSNRASYQAAKNELSGSTMDAGTYDALHAMDYLVFGELQLAQDKAAKQVVDEAAARVAVEHLGWDEERAEREVREYREWIERYTPKRFRERETAGA